MTIEDWDLLRAAIAEKSLLLMRHEDKGFAKTGLDLSNYTELVIGKRTFYTVSTPVFREILEHVLPEATSRYPHLFGTGRAEDVLNALYQTHPFSSPERFAAMLGKEQFCYVLEIADGKVNDRVLRIDLFRQIEKNENGSDFTGGIMHAFKHFSCDSVPLSTGTDQHDIQPPAIIFLLTKAFLLDPGTPIGEDGYRAISPWDERYNIRYSFYYEQKTAVYFVKAAFKTKRKKGLSDR